ncbi:restriction endonuclease [Embleya sp. NPDC005971]|uniref:restriction endonuclease n=1 Tax=Embleya sp. NPDC005971 TaxID=3156724 RepID=UPI0033EA05CF
MEHPAVRAIKASARSWSHRPSSGGYCIVQAKHYAKCIQPDAVLALAGVLGQDHHASKAIFVTAS